MRPNMLPAMSRVRCEDKIPDQGFVGPGSFGWAIIWLAAMAFRGLAAMQRCGWIACRAAVEHKIWFFTQAIVAGLRLLACRSEALA